MSSLFTKTQVSSAPVASHPGSRRYRGFSTVSTHTENYKLYDFELIKQDLLNNFYVRQGERLMNPTFGTIIWDVIFEPLTDELKNAVLQNVNQIFNSDPRIRVGSIVITPYETGLEIQCELIYVLYNIQQKLQMQFDQANGFSLQ
jgi:phage baseplate assembly protein W